ncbi:MAG TPA: hypothetical protein VJ697_08695 [Nitrososphaeraceae archaeon]|nr:hypothetical protein [Nitrososphaeraceae archaeon]
MIRYNRASIRRSMARDKPEVWKSVRMGSERTFYRTDNNSISYLFKKVNISICRILKL